MIKVRCETSNTLTIGELTAFQGSFKVRSSKDVEQLKNSLLEDGLIMPFVVWRCGVDNMLLDGHGRLIALTDLVLQDNEIGTQAFPVLYIEAESEDEAKKALLQITSSYGRVNKEGALKFCQTIPNYRAPVINKFTHKPKVKVKKEQQELYTIIKIRIPAEKAEAVAELLKQVSYIEVL